MSVPDVILKLCETFAAHKDHYKSAKYNETELRREFLDPFFKALGWDVDNEAGYADAYKDVIHEDAIKMGGYTKAPDYCFRIGGVRKFFVEAKRPATDIGSELDPAFQLRRYGWSAKLPLSILTDFEQFAVYDTRIRPAKNDKPATARTLFVPHDEYAGRWNEIASIFSREAVLKGSFDKYADTTKIKRGTGAVDEIFLKEIERWRDLLARNIALRNKQLSVRDLNYAVQKIIDRIIFLRICEDRGTEDYGRLETLLNGGRTYTRLMQLFLQADDRYNSGLFHFNTVEKDRPSAPDTLTPDLTIDDKAIKDILKNLYFPDSPYEFSVLPADILGQVYEQFLGKTIRLTASHQARIEEKPEVRKAGGVYYTPAYIVEYIVRNTLGRLLDGENPDKPSPIPVSKAAEIKVIDPACGSGSFLIAAYQYLLDWHLRQYTADPKTGERDEAKIKRHAGGRNPKIYQSAGDIWRLTTGERKRILLNNIHGVDIDAQAVEVTKLSLLLKVLEGETKQHLQRDFIHERQRILPDLGHNIQCGNSLIGPDFYENEQMLLLDEETKYRINVFDWNQGFPEIMKRGGFDCVIGNPPWGASVHTSASKYLADKHRRVVDRMTDTYVYFLDKALLITHGEGCVGFVIPATLLNQSDTRSARRLLLNEGVSALVNMGAGIFGRGATNTTLVLIARRGASTNTVFLNDLQHLDIAIRAQRMGRGEAIPLSKWKQLVKQDPMSTFFVSGLQDAGLLLKLQKQHPPLSEILMGPIQRGATPDCAEMHMVPNDSAGKYEAELLRKSVSGNAIKRYASVSSNCSILYTTRQTDIERYPRTRTNMAAYRDRLKCKEIQEGKHPWWSLHRPRDPTIFTSPKFIGVTTSRRIEIVYDKSEDMVVTDACYVFKVLPNHDHRYVLGLLHSRLFDWCYKTANQGDSRVIPQVKAAKLAPLPVRRINFEDHADVMNHNKMVQLVDRMLELNKTKATEKNPNTLKQLQTQLTATDCQIDRLVYELYGLTEEEIEIVECIL